MDRQRPTSSASSLLSDVLCHQWPAVLRSSLLSAALRGQWPTFFCRQRPPFQSPTLFCHNPPAFQKMKLKTDCHTRKHSVSHLEARACLARGQAWCLSQTPKETPCITWLTCPPLPPDGLRSWLSGGCWICFLDLGFRCLCVSCAELFGLGL